MVSKAAPVSAFIVKTMGFERFWVVLAEVSGPTLVTEGFFLVTEGFFLVTEGFFFVKEGFF